MYLMSNTIFNQVAYITEWFTLLSSLCYLYYYFTKQLTYLIKNILIIINIFSAF